MKTITLALVLIGGTSIYRYTIFNGLDDRIIRKEQLLSRELERRGLRDSYVIISGYRPKWFNRMLPLSSPKSSHMRGLAIDILVGDVNGDSKIDKKDIRLTVECLIEIDEKHPELYGGIGTYRSSRRMIHFDVSGNKKRWLSYGFN